MENLLYAVPVVGVISLVVALMLKSWIAKQDEGNDRIVEIVKKIQDGELTATKENFKLFDDIL